MPTPTDPSKHGRTRTPGSEYRAPEARPRPAGGSSASEKAKEAAAGRQQPPAVRSGKGGKSASSASKLDTAKGAASLARQAAGTAVPGGRMKSARQTARKLSTKEGRADTARSATAAAKGALQGASSGAHGAALGALKGLADAEGTKSDEAKQADKQARQPKGKQHQPQGGRVQVNGTRGSAPKGHGNRNMLIGAILTLALICVPFLSFSTSSPAVTGGVYQDAKSQGAGSTADPAVAASADPSATSSASASADPSASASADATASASAGASAGATASSGATAGATKSGGGKADAKAATDDPTTATCSTPKSSSGVDTAKLQISDPDGDYDHDGTPNSQDADADGNGKVDLIEMGSIDLAACASTAKGADYVTSGSVDSNGVIHHSDPYTSGAAVFTDAAGSTRGATVVSAVGSGSGQATVTNVAAEDDESVDDRAIVQSGLGKDAQQVADIARSHGVNPLILEALVGQNGPWQASSSDQVLDNAEKVAQSLQDAKGKTSAETWSMGTGTVECSGDVLVIAGTACPSGVTSTGDGAIKAKQVREAWVEAMMGMQGLGAPSSSGSGAAGDALAPPANLSGDQTSMLKAIAKETYGLPDSAVTVLKDKTKDGRTQVQISTIQALEYMSTLATVGDKVGVATVKGASRSWSYDKSWGPMEGSGPESDPSMDRTVIVTLCDNGWGTECKTDKVEGRLTREQADSVYTTALGWYLGGQDQCSSSDAVDTSTTTGTTDGTGVLVVGDSYTNGSIDALKKTFPKATYVTQVGAQASWGLDRVKAAKAEQKKNGIVFLFGTNGAYDVNATLDAVKKETPSGKVAAMTVYSPKANVQSVGKQINDQVKAWVSANGGALVDWASVSSGHDDYFRDDKIHPADGTGRDQWNSAVSTAINTLTGASGASATASAAPSAEASAAATDSSGADTATSSGATSSTGSSSITAGQTVKSSTGESLPMTDKRIANAQKIIGEGNKEGMSNDQIIVALMTALVESKLTNLANPVVPESMSLPHEGTGSDLDSVGLFQQRNTWGSAADRMDPAKSASLFYVRLKPWMAAHPGAGLGEAAQGVQVSAVPTAYQAWEQVARQLAGLSGIASGTGGSSSCTVASSGEGWGYPEHQVAPISSEWQTARTNPVTGVVRPHWGTDIAGPDGTEILSASDGTVFSASCESGDNGLCLIAIDTSDGWRIQYLHVQTNSWTQYGITKGAQVKKGQPIAKEGNTGVGTGSHLHLETIKISNLPSGWNVCPFDAKYANACQNPREVFKAHGVDLETGQVTAVAGSTASGSTNAAVAFAQTQVGGSYVWGGNGNADGSKGGYDCSGLVKASYAKIGIDLPHLAAAQCSMGQAVDIKDAKEGDLLCWGNPAYHVALYDGHGGYVGAQNESIGIKAGPLYGDYYVRRIVK